MSWQKNSGHVLKNVAVDCDRILNMKFAYSLYTDGGSRDNPGLAAIGGILKDEHGTEVLSFSQFIGISTNNVAEYTALIFGLNLAFKNNLNEIECFLDSELIVKQVNGEYKVKDPNLKALHQAVLRLVSKFDEIKFTYVPREKNKEADTLVNKALDEIS